MIRAGMLRHVLLVQQPVIEYGNITGYAPPVYPVLRCEFLDSASSKEQTGDTGQLGVTTQKIRCRYRADITHQTQLTSHDDQTQIFDIVGIENVKNMNQELILTLEQHARG